MGTDDLGLEHGEASDDDPEVLSGMRLLTEIRAAQDSISDFKPRRELSREDLLNASGLGGDVREDEENLGKRRTYLAPDALWRAVMGDADSDSYDASAVSSLRAAYEAGYQSWS